MKKGAYFFRLKLEVFVKLYQKFVDIIVTLIWQLWTVNLAQKLLLWEHMRSIIDGK